MSSTYEPRGRTGAGPTNVSEQSAFYAPCYTCLTISRGTGKNASDGLLSTEDGERPRFRSLTRRPVVDRTTNERTNETHGDDKSNVTEESGVQPKDRLERA